MGAELGDKRSSDPHELVGEDIVIEYRLRVQKVIRLRFCTVLKGVLPNGQPFNVSLDDKEEYVIKAKTPRRGWRIILRP
jgi:hypothetical protein